MSLGTILLIILILMLLGVLPTWPHARSWGYGPSGIVGVLLVAFVMLVSASILIANTVRMGLFARRKEIGIMKLVGATNWRIRLPFLVEGLFESLIGAIAAILFLFAIKVAFIEPLNESVQFIPWIVNKDLIAIIPILLVAGALVALVAGLVGMRRFLDV